MNHPYQHQPLPDPSVQPELHASTPDTSDGGIFRDPTLDAPEPTAFAFTPDGPGATDYELELNAMRSVCRTLETLSAESRGRVIDWVGKVLDERRKLEPTPIDLNHMVVRYGMPH